MSHVVFFLAAWAALFGCSAAQSQEAYANVPYCSDGNRARSCITSRMCAVTAQGCKVCRCEALNE